MRLLATLVAAAVLLVTAGGGHAAGVAPGSAGADSPGHAPRAGDHLPGAAPHPPGLAQRLRAAYRAKGADYAPRTEHLLEDGSARFTNRLILEDSPYLIQHAHNPVDWYPWGAEAFAKAAREGKPIFLSIGYSTCHWCHVMERQSFDNLEVARLLNDAFVSIKVDRERRPDLDAVYMTAKQLISGRGGWPLSSFLTPKGEPFFVATYYPREKFMRLLNLIEQAWRSERQKLLATASLLAVAVSEATRARGRKADIGPETIDQALRETLALHDEVLGGFGTRPKFPRAPMLLFLLQSASRSGHPEALRAVEKSLQAMARGGLHDQIGGGFHRYATDAAWRIPHFEKMLYTQAYLARAYLAAHRLTGRASYARVARQTLDYVLREMTGAGGGFYSATDADSDGGEGAFFVWTRAEIEGALPPADAALAIELYGVSRDGSVDGKNILHLPEPLAAVAERHHLTLPELWRRVDRIRETLRAARARRPPPLRDEKILTAWNGMMITALARGYEVLREPRYLAGARRAAEFVWRRNRQADGRLWRVHLAGNSSLPALQEDYAFLAEALLALFDATREEAWLSKARALADAMLEQFWDARHGGFFMSAANADRHLIALPKDSGDRAVPSGNSVALRVLTCLAARTGESSYRQKAEATLAGFSEALERFPSGHTYMLLAMAELAGGAVGARQYAAQGTVAATATLHRAGDGRRRLVVDVHMRDGWHINAHEPLQDYLIPTVLSLDAGRGPWRLGAVAYPEPERVRLSFQETPLALYQGHARFEAEVAWEGASEMGAAPVLPVRIKVQACSDEVCLLPEEIVLEVPAAAAKPGSG